MSQRFSIACIGLAVIGSMTLPAVAWADDSPLGFKIGPGALHAFFDVEGRYDTAAEAITNPTTDVPEFQGDLIWHFRPGIKLEVPSDAIAVSLTAAVEYLYYTGLNGSSAASPLDRFQGEGALDIAIFRGSTVSANVGDHLTRSNQTQNPGLPYGVISLDNDAYLNLPITPGQGSLTITPGYHLMTEFYQPLLNIPETGFNASYLNYMTNQITLQNRWRFLPKTAILLDGEYDFRNYLTSGSGNANVQFFQATTGLAGLLTPHIATIVRVGYGQTTSDNAVTGLDGLVGQIEGSYLPNEVTSIRLGVSRTFAPVATSPLTTTTSGSTTSGGNYSAYDDSRPYLGASTLLFGRLVLRGLVSLDLLNFSGATNTTTARNDTVFMVDVGADFAAFRWLTLTVGNTFTDRSSNETAFGLNFQDEQVYGRISFHY